MKLICIILFATLLSANIMYAYSDDSPPVIPPSDTGVGLFYDIGWMDRIEEGGRRPEAVRRHFREMVDAGCNTLTLYATSVEESAMQMDIAIEEGLVGRFPVILLPGSYERVLLDQYVESAKGFSKYAEQWPEVVVYGPDETDGGQQDSIALIAEQVHAASMRLCLTTWAPLDYAGIADIIIPIAGVCTEELRAGIREAGSEFWAYEIGAFHYGSNYHMARFITGLWRWKAGPEVWLGWSYMDSRGDSPVMRGMRDGTLDYRVLRALEEAVTKLDNPEAYRWLEQLRADIPWNPSTGLPDRAPRYTRPSLDWETGIPKMAQFDHYRQWAGYYLSVITGCDQIW